MLEFNATFFVAMFSFIIFMLMMNSILYKPLSRIVEQRENIIRENYSDAELTNEKIEDITAQHKANIEETRTLAKEQFNQKLNNYKAQKNEILESAKLLAKKTLKDKRRYEDYFVSHKKYTTFFIVTKKYGVQKIKVDSEDANIFFDK